MQGIEAKESNEPKSLLDQILEFIDQFECTIEVKHIDGRQIHVMVDGCIGNAGDSNKLIQEKLCPGLSFESVIVRDDRFVFECVERDMTLIILYKSPKTKAKESESPYIFDSPFGMPRTRPK